MFFKYFPYGCAISDHLEFSKYFPSAARLVPHLIKLAHYVVPWLVEENQLFNSQTWAAGTGGEQQAPRLIPRTLISNKARSQLCFLAPALFSC